MAGKTIGELEELTSVNDSSFMALSADGKTLGKVGTSTLKNSIIGQHITNYVRTIDQHINLVLNNGVLTLKSGSSVYSGDGTVIPVQSDVSFTWSTATLSNLILVYDQVINELGIYVQGGNIFVSDTQPETTVADSLWFNTTNHKMMITHDTGSTWYEIGLPIGVVSYQQGYGCTGISKIFNGFGYIGNVIFSLPGITAEIPDGKNQNCTAKNSEITTTDVRFVVIDTLNTKVEVNLLLNSLDYLQQDNYIESDIEPTNQSGYVLWLNKYLNVFLMRNFSTANSYWQEYSAVGAVCKATLTNGVITSFTNKEPLALLDSNTLDNIPHLIEVYSDGVNWYRLYSDGWIEQGGRASKGQTTITLLIAMANTNYCVYKTLDYGTGSVDWTETNNSQENGIAKTTTSFTCGTRNGDWEVKGFIA